MADKTNQSYRYTLDVNERELHFLQHCLVYAGSCITGNSIGAKQAFIVLYQTLPFIDPDDLQKRILTLVGVDISKIDDAHEGITWINSDGSLEKEPSGQLESDDKDVDVIKVPLDTLTDKNIQ